MSTTNGIDLIKKTTFNVKSPERDCWIDRQGNIISNETHHHVEKALELLIQFDKEREYKNLIPCHVKEFEQANKNKGYDAGEWLVITYGYIAIEGYKAIYRADNKTKPTKKQQNIIDCLLYDGVLISADSEIGLKILEEEKQKKKEAEQKQQENVNGVLIIENIILILEINFIVHQVIQEEIMKDIKLFVENMV